MAKSKKRVQGGKKGAAFERSTCVRLSLWVSDKKRDDVFWRSAMSGGRATLAARRGKSSRFQASVGDVTAVDQLGNCLLDHFVIECKFRKDLNLEAPVYGLKNPWSNVWHKPVGEALTYNRHPIVIAKRNHRVPVAMLNKAGVESMFLGQPKKPDCRAIFPQEDCYVFDLTDFLLSTDFNVFRENHA